MNKREISRYFKDLSKIYRRPCRVILTEAGAGTFYGRIRATMDLDFALELKARGPAKEKAWREFERCAREISEKNGIAAQYAEDIDRWSLNTYLDYQNHTRAFKHFGSIEVRLLEPAYWAIGKLTRYLDPDIQDVIEVMRRSRTSFELLAKVLGKALKKSPKSTACELFRRQVEDFFKTYGRRAWGKKFDSFKTIAIFHRTAGIRH